MTFARAAQAQGHSVFCVGVLGMASDELGGVCDDFVTAPLPQMGKAIRLFNKANIRRAVMAGKIEKTAIFRRFRWLRCVPDWRTLHMVFNYVRKDKKDDTILLEVIREFARDDIHFE